jgi:tagatose-1,6-bisphosphate aldolase non-catalytic subunit AgaZ/GatZ
VILGGDHLGPNPWKALPAEEAMARAETMIAAFAEAGFTKLHLDTSMGCAGEPVALDDALTAERAARLAQVAEAHRGGREVVYVIGTEVPVPGGALEELDELAVTTQGAVLQTYDTHRDGLRRARSGAEVVSSTSANSCLR